MESPMSDEGVRKIVKLLVARGVESGGEVANAMIQDLVVQAGLKDDDLVTAGELGWIDKGSRPGTTRLTSAGFAVGSNSA